MPESEATLPRGGPVRILHVSDLHLGGADAKRRWHRRRVLGPAWQDNLKRIQEDGPIDLVCFTGDIANRGQQAEYDEATDFFGSLRDTLKIGPERVFVVPGNHDIDRSASRRAWRGLRNAVQRGVDREGLSIWMAGLGDAPLGVSAQWRDAVLDRGAAFRKWLAAVGCGHCDPKRSPHGRLGYRVSLKTQDGGLLHILGLDSAWLSGSDADSGQLLVTEDQQMQLATDAAGKPLEGLRLALIHHPLHDLADADELRALLAGHVDVILRGHLHTTGLSVWSDPDRVTVELAVGCLYERPRADRHPNACQVLSIERRDGVVQGSSWFRTWSTRGHWHDDDSLYQHTTGGRLQWRLRARAPLAWPEVELSSFDAAARGIPPLVAAHGAPEVAKRLAERLAEERDPVRQGILCFALGGIETPLVAPVLERIARDVEAHPYVRREARKALQKLVGET
jgi:predicted phosphodiesterase